MVEGRGIASSMNATVSRLASRIAEELGQAAASARRETAERLNQASRRLRQSRSDEEVYAALSDSAARFAKRVVLLRVAEGGDKLSFTGGSETAIPLEAAPAIAAAVSSADTVVAMCTPGELSPPVAAALGEAPDRRLCIQPVRGRGETMAVLCAVSEETAALELLASIAGSALESLSPKPPARPADPVAIAQAPAPAASAIARADQPIHLRAQRFARVRVAEMRLRKPGAVLGGRASGDLYTRLRLEIDAARGEFRRQFLAPCPSMPDYFHLEVLRALANDQTALFGADYPGPLTS
jgi:hypothetical protein